MAGVIATYDQFVHALRVLKESKSGEDLSIYDDFVLVVQPGGSRKDPIDVHVFLKLDGKAYKVKSMKVPYAGRVPLYKEDGLTKEHNYYLGKLPKGISADLPGLGMLRIEGAHKVLVTLDRDYEDLQQKEFGGVKGFVMTGKEHNLASSAISKRTIKNIPAKGKENNRYAFYTELAPDKPLKIDFKPKPKPVDPEPVVTTTDLTKKDVTFSVAAEFKADSAELQARNTSGSTPKQAIDKAVAGLLASMKEAGTKQFAIDIYAFASKEGDDEHNKKLSQQRADAVGKYINSMSNGIVVKKAVGVGETDRFGSNLADNRRIVAVPSGKTIK